MTRQVLKKQNNSRMCFVCGFDNAFGLHASFYETDAGAIGAASGGDANGASELVAIVLPRDEHQSYPGRMHGGVAAALLDETIGRAIGIGKNDQVWGVTVELTTKYRKPVPLDRKITVVGRVTKDAGRFFEGSGEILLENGEVAVEAHGRYLKVPIDRITESGMDASDWFLRDDPADPREIELPSSADHS
jgi:acyl-coenzyme A thioesterase PaaI-like protein